MRTWLSGVSAARGRGPGAPSPPLRDGRHRRAGLPGRAGRCNANAPIRIPTVYRLNQFNTNSVQTSKTSDVTADHLYYILDSGVTFGNSD